MCVCVSLQQTTLKDEITVKPEVLEDSLEEEVTVDEEMQEEEDPQNVKYEEEEEGGGRGEVKHVREMRPSLFPHPPSVPPVCLHHGAQSTKHTTKR